MSRRFCAIFTGCVHGRESNTVWRRCAAALAALAALAFRCQHGMAPSSLSSELQRASDVVSGRHLRSPTTTLVVPRKKRSTIDDRAFPVATARVWNRLSPAVAGCHYPVIVDLREKLNTELVLLSYPDI